MARQIDPQYARETFKHETTLRVRFADLDALGHVNHAAYLTYMEQARMQYAADVWMWDGKMENLTMIVAAAEVNYLAPMFLNDHVHVFTRIARLGTKSFDMNYLIQREEADGTLRNVATGKTSMVMFDYVNNRTIDFHDAWRKRTLSYEDALA